MTKSSSPLRKEALNAVYLDANASLLLPEAWSKGEQGAALRELWLTEARGNPSSLHRQGRRARGLILRASEQAARFLGAPFESLYWTSGATESLNWILIAPALRALSEGRSYRILTTAMEHEAVRSALKTLSSWPDLQIDLVHTLPTGELDLSHAAELMEKAKESGLPYDLASIIGAHNETGVIQPLEELIVLIRKHNPSCKIHIDAVQMPGKIPSFQFSNLGADFATFSPHKLGALSGVGILCCTKSAERWLPALIAGKQQKGRRGGTENTFGIAYSGFVFQLWNEGHLRWPQEAATWHRHFEQRWTQTFGPDAVIHGAGAKRRLPNTTFFALPTNSIETCLMKLDQKGIFVSSGSACSSGGLQPSATLVAMGVGDHLARSSIRISSGLDSTEMDFEKLWLALLSLEGTQKTWQTHQSEFSLHSVGASPAL